MQAWIHCIMTVRNYSQQQTWIGMSHDSNDIRKNSLDSISDEFGNNFT